MKRYFLLFGSVFFLFFPSKSKGQDVEDDPMPGGWSLGVSTGFQYAVSSSMHGEITEYESALAAGATAAQYPFAGNRAYAIGFGAQIEKRIRRSPVSLYVNAYGMSLRAGNGFRNAEGGRYTMTVLSTSGGIEYTFGQLYQSWNFYGRIGIVSSTIGISNRGSSDRFSDSLRLSGSDSRIGIEIEVGERYHFPRSAIGIEASINYTNVNLFGKSYTDPANAGGLFSRGSFINDGKNPDDANDTPRTIDFLSLRVGARIYF